MINSTAIILPNCVFKIQIYKKKHRKQSTLYILLIKRGEILTIIEKKPAVADFSFFNIYNKH